MEKKRTGQFVALMALVVGVIGVSVGFSAFSNALKIQSSATVTPDESTLNVDFSSLENSVDTSDIKPAVTGTITATDAKINNTSDPVISNLSATFTEPGQKATYSFYAYNAGELTAYLKSIVYGNAQGETSTKVCKAKEGTTDALVQKACEGISLKVKVGTEAETTSGIGSITNHSLLKGAGEAITVTLEYAAGAERADGDFTVSFGDVTLNYSSAD